MDGGRARAPGVRASGASTYDGQQPATSLVRPPHPFSTPDGVGPYPDHPDLLNRERVRQKSRLDLKRVLMGTDRGETPGVYKFQGLRVSIRRSPAGGPPGGVGLAQVLWWYGVASVTIDRPTDRPAVRRLQPMNPHPAVEPNPLPLCSTLDPSPSLPLPPPALSPSREVPTPLTSPLQVHTPIDPPAPSPLSPTWQCSARAARANAFPVPSLAFSLLPLPCSCLAVPSPMPGLVA